MDDQKLLLLLLVGHQIKHRPLSCNPSWPRHSFWLCFGACRL